MIRIRLKEVAQSYEKENNIKITNYWISKNSGVRPNTINTMMDNEEDVKNISKDALNRLCKLFKCQVGDLVEYIKEE
ncbi:helix-turn-helix domain-containing protein [Brevibacillus ginsengisoli]|uniref:helix-turn-helix domain-containing protein n=1 Tax=Brevibacillus ginsengisoli TaxID=363854 RepID=UPI003CF72072